jgi:diacylglycerol kinase family enzyme
MKKIPIRITPHTGGQEKILMRKKKEAMRKPKRHESSRNSNARGHAQITRKNDIQDKVSMS